MSYRHGWESATLADVAVWGSGGTPRATEASYYGGSIPWAVIGDLNDSTVARCSSSLTEAGLKNSNAKLVPIGSVLLAMYGSIGKLGIAGVPLATNQAIAYAAVQRDILDPRFLFWYLMSQRDALMAAGQGATQRNISQTIIRSWTIRFPKLEEQRQVVTAIEQQLSRIDAAADSISAASARLSRVLELIHARVHADDYPLVKLGSIAKTSSGGTPSRSKPANFKGSIPWIKSGELGDGRVRQTTETISEAGLASSSAKRLPRGTLLMAMYGATIGKLGIVDVAGAATNQAVCAIEPSDPELTPFLWIALRGMRSALVRAAIGGAQPNISQGIIRNLEIPLPPREVQRSIIAETTEAVSRYKRLQESLAGIQKRKNSLRQAILASAFSGRLVDGRRPNIGVGTAGAQDITARATAE